MTPDEQILPNQSRDDWFGRISREEIEFLPYRNFSPEKPEIPPITAGKDSDGIGGATSWKGRSMTMNTTTNAMLNYKEVALLLGVPLGTVYAWVHEKKLPHVRLGARMVRFDRDEIMSWIDARRVPVER